MILTDREIQAAIEHGEIDISPRPGSEAFSSTSLDLTLGSTLRQWQTPTTGGVEQQVISPSDEGYKYIEVARELTRELHLDHQGFVFEPHMFLLAWTAEQVSLPPQSRLAARVEGKSSLARLGIGVHITAPTIHAGFKGHLQLEMYNHAPLRVRLKPGMRICQLIFEQTLGIPGQAYGGQFLGQ